MNGLYFVLLLIAAVCFACAAIRRPATKLDLLAVGLFFWVLVPLIMYGRLVVS